MAETDEEVCNEFYRVAINEIKTRGKPYQDIQKALICGNNLYYVIDSTYYSEIFLVIGYKTILSVFPELTKVYNQNGIIHLIASLSMDDKDEILRRNIHIKAPMIVTKNLQTNKEHFVYRNNVYSSPEIYEILH